MVLSPSNVAAARTFGGRLDMADRHLPTHRPHDLLVGFDDVRAGLALDGLAEAGKDLQVIN